MFTNGLDDVWAGVLNLEAHTICLIPQTWFGGGVLFLDRSSLLGMGARGLSGEGRLLELLPESRVKGTRVGENTRESSLIRG